MDGPVAYALLHFLQGIWLFKLINSSKDFENLKKSLPVTGKDEKQHQMFVTYDPSGSTSSKTDIKTWALEYHCH